MKGKLFMIVRGLPILFLVVSLVSMWAMPTNTARADPGVTEWSQVTTPSEDDWVIGPESNLILWGTGCTDGFETLGEMLYAMGSSPDLIDYDNPIGTALCKSTDSGATWSDKTLKELIQAEIAFS